MRTKLLLIEAVALALLGFLSTGFDFGGFHIDVNIAPPPIEINGPPEVAVIPGTYVYFVPDVSAELFFYDGYWYRPYEGNWYRCTSYSGPWAYIDRESVPDVFFHLPSDYRAMSEYRRIPYRELNENWRTWQRDRYWDRVGWERDREREHGVAPSYGYEGREREYEVAPEFRDRQRDDFYREGEHGVAPEFRGGEREHGVVPEFRDRERNDFYREREHGIAPEFRGGEEQNLDRSNQGERQNQTERQNMNRGGYGREER